MGKNLVIVESPAKAKTIEKYLGKEYQVLASYGHVRDLIPKEGAVDTANGFQMVYQIIEKNERHVAAIAKALTSADALYLATDPDREGEAISWHLYELLRERGKLKKKPVYRVVFHEITKRAISEAIANPRELSGELVNAQQARRALDYLVGFNLSPLLWKKVRRGLSAGRVQSPALRLIVERELEIEAFKPREYWTIGAEVEKEATGFTAKLSQFEGDKIEQFSITDGERAAQVTQSLQKAAGGQLTVVSVEKKQRKRNPAPPFITSTLQQEAVRKLRFSAQRAMRVAQQLYEGIDIGGETVGLITYMRTDSVTLANEAVDEIRGFIAERYGAKQMPEQPRQYKTKSKNAQEAHEAVRPTSVLRTPESLAAHLSKEQMALYELIWKRTVASQMSHATFDTVGVDLACGKVGIFRATGSTLVDPGFMAVYQEGRDDSGNEDEDKLLPPLNEGESITLNQVTSDQHFTEPPPRYTEASLVRALEDFGIGRPSTYASIISTLLQREYVELDKRRFMPTDVGRVVSKFLTEHFTQYVDYDFTARLEDELDAVARGEQDWVPLLESFWQPFHDLVEDKEKNVRRSDVTQELIEENCPTCGKQLAIRLGRRGRFIGCSGFPDCDYTRNLDESRAEAEAPQIVEGRQCPKCNSDLLIRNGRYGKFIGCSSYPDCNHIEPLEKPAATGVTCPQCKQGEMLQRRSRSGKTFFSCSRFPDCDYAVWNQPLDEPCPSCGWPMLTVKTTKRRGTEKVCPERDCRFSEIVEDATAEAATDNS